MEGAGYQQPGFTGLWCCQRQAEARIFGRVAGLALKQQAPGRDTLFAEKLSSHVGLRGFSTRQIPQRSTAACEEKPRFRKALSQLKGSRIALAALVKLHLTPEGTGARILTTSQHDDPVDLVQRRLCRETPLNRLQEQITEGKDCKGDQQVHRDGSNPKRKTAAVQHHRQDDDSQCQNDPGVWPQQCADQFRGDEEDCVHQRARRRVVATASRAAR